MEVVVILLILVSLEVVLALGSAHKDQLDCLIALLPMSTSVFQSSLINLLKSLWRITKSQLNC